MLLKVFLKLFVRLTWQLERVFVFGIVSRMNKWLNSVMQENVFPNVIVWVLTIHCGISFVFVIVKRFSMMIKKNIHKLKIVIAVNQIYVIFVRYLICRYFHLNVYNLFEFVRHHSEIAFPETAAFTWLVFELYFYELNKRKLK